MILTSLANKYPVYAKQKYGISIHIATLILNKICRHRDLLNVNPSADVVRDPDRNPEPEKVRRACFSNRHSDRNPLSTVSVSRFRSYAQHACANRASDPDPFSFYSRVNVTRGVTTIYEGTGCAIFWSAFLPAENKFWGIIFGKMTSSHKFWGVILEK